MRTIVLTAAAATIPPGPERKIKHGRWGERKL